MIHRTMIQWLGFTYKAAIAATAITIEGGLAAMEDGTVVDFRKTGCRKKRQSRYNYDAAIHTITPDHLFVNVP
jgi:hypothetical protein